MWWPGVVRLRLDYGRSPHAYVNQRLQIQLELLMINVMPLETCWAFNEQWNNKFYYKVASCWLFLLIQTVCSRILLENYWHWIFEQFGHHKNDARRTREIKSRMYPTIEYPSNRRCRSYSIPDTALQFWSNSIYSTIFSNWQQFRLTLKSPN